jgi:hypothetical protein
LTGDPHTKRLQRRNSEKTAASPFFETLETAQKETSEKYRKDKL